MTQDGDSSDLGPKPEAAIEPGEANPGGPDAAPDAGTDLDVPDLPTGSNPAVDDKAPESLKDSLAAGEDTSTQATEGEGGTDEGEDETVEAPV